jgi:proline iminopeptidase
MSCRGHWHEHRLQRPDHAMAWNEIGDGPTVLVVHGSYDSVLYTALGEMLAAQGRHVVLYDQRGAERSPLTERSDQTLHIDRFMEDLDALRAELGAAVDVLGHSWGATLAMLYAARYPRGVRKLILANMGPFTESMRAVYRANTERMTAPGLRSTWKSVNDAYRAARRAGLVPPELDEALIRHWAPVIFHDSDNAERFVELYLASGGWRRHAPDARGLPREAPLDAAGTVTAPTLILYGSNDYEPIMQAYMLQERIAGSRVVMLDECGHMPWWDQGEMFARVVDLFLGRQP